MFYAKVAVKTANGYKTHYYSFDDIAKFANHLAVYFKDKWYENTFVVEDDMLKLAKAYRLKIKNLK